MCILQIKSYACMEIVPESFGNETNGIRTFQEVERGLMVMMMMMMTTMMTTVTVTVTMMMTMTMTNV